MFFLLAFIASECVFAQLAYARTITVVGGRSCEKWVADRSFRTKVIGDYAWIASAISEAWVLGLMNGMNSQASTEKDLLYSVDGGLIYAWMDRYCKENMDSDIYEGAKKLFYELEKSSVGRRNIKKVP